MEELIKDLDNWGYEYSNADGVISVPFARGFGADLFITKYSTQFPELSYSTEQHSNKICVIVKTK